ncbi:sensor histidine kinase [Leucobacter denitrificans]|uniref:sensor histidine kinase n=1 Tax=Leucobacter denitrificans TaxID=683042 RepID=UPI001FE7B0CE|nr:histidine kinase [Leucobacter denitrificans]
MTIRGESERASTRFQLGQAEPLTRPERIAVLVLIGGIVSIDLVGFFTSSDLDWFRTLLSIATTLSFALFIWSPLIAVSTLAGVIAVSLFVGSAAPALVAGAIAAGLVLRLASTTIIFAYVGGLLILNALYAFLYGEDATMPTSIALVLISATLSGGVGLALRISYARGTRLERELVEQAEREREAVLAERKWIAGELHDSIAHHLTVIAMHVQLVDDENSRPTSQSAIQTSARKALSDLRFVIQMAEDAPRGTGVPSGDLAAAIEEATEEFEATGRTVACVGDPNDENIPRGAEIIFARVVRESATNVLKYAGMGEVRIEISLEPETVSLKIHSPLPDVPRRDLPSTGTGLNRMAERVLGVSGEFTAGPDESDPESRSWLVSVRLPMA